LQAITGCKNYFYISFSHCIPTDASTNIRNGYHTIACPMELKISQQIDMDKNGLISKIFLI